MSTLTKKQQLIDVAIQMFCEGGFHATGIDKILKKSGISKKTMYAHFRSKDDLILAALDQYDKDFRENFIQQVENSGDTAEERLLGVFDVIHSWFSQDDFYGCVFIKAVGEFSDVNDVICEASRRFKKTMRNYLYDLCVDARAEDSETLATELALLINGAIVSSQFMKSSEPAITAKNVARKLIAAALK